MSSVRFFAAVLLVLVIPSLRAQDSLVTYSAAGFSFSPPESQQPATGKVVIAFLPASQGFSPNVNVMIQPYPASLRDYDQLTQAQFKQGDVSVVTQEVADDHLLYEYKGNIRGRSLHFYARALKRDSSVYLITATDLEQNWAEDKEALVHSVASFVLSPKHP